VLSEVGATADKTQINALIAAVKGRPFHSIIRQGLSQVSTMADYHAPVRWSPRRKRKRRKPRRR